MRRLINYFIFSLGLFFIANPAYAQIQLGTGLAFVTGDNISRLGVNFRGTYEIDDKIVASPGVSFLLKDKSLRDVTVSYFSLDLDGQYRLLEVGDGVQIYPVAGLNFFNVKISGDSTVPLIENGLNVGLNLGVGAQVASLSNWSYFGEFKFRVGGEVNAQVMAGVLYGF